MMKGVALGLLIEVLSVFVRVLVPFFALVGRYPWWMVTPDDPTSPFGKYETTVREIYARFGRYIGDVYWLGWRNVAYGLSYRFKPARYKGMTDYSGLRQSVRPIRKGVLRYEVDGLPLWQIGLGKFEVLAGWMVRGVVLDPYTVREEINLEFRPIFSVRRAG